MTPDGLRECETCHQLYRVPGCRQFKRIGVLVRSCFECAARLRHLRVVLPWSWRPKSQHDASHAGAAALRVTRLDSTTIAY